MKLNEKPCVLLKTYKGQEIQGSEKRSIKLYLHITDVFNDLHKQDKFETMLLTAWKLIINKYSMNYRLIYSQNHQSMYDRMIVL